MGYDYIGMSFQEKKAQEGVPPVAIFGLSLLFVFLILAALYESWSLPFSVLLGVPVAVFGAYVTLFIRQMENNVFAQIGLIMLIGLSAKNAILIVEFARTRYEHGVPLLEAALAGREDPPAAHPDDLVRVHLRVRSPLARQRLGGGRAQGDGDDGHRRHARGERPGDLPDSGDLLRRSRCGRPRASRTARARRDWPRRRGGAREGAARRPAPGPPAD